MKVGSLKPFDDGKYLSEEESLKLLESIPIPKDDSEKVNAPKVEPDTSITESPGLENRIIQLDSLPADNGSQKTQDGWITYWNNINDGRIFASMADYYLAFKQLKEKFEHGSAPEKQFAQKTIDILREDFDWPTNGNLLISSTKIRYFPDQEKADIIPYCNCNKKSVILYSTILIPEYCGVLVSNVLDDPKGLTYLQTLFKTKDDKEEITLNLEFISHEPRTKIKIYTPSLKEDKADSTRGYIQERGSCFCYGLVGFNISGSNISSRGRSHGVRINNNPISGGAP